MPQPLPGCDFGKVSFDLAHQLRRRRRAAVGRRSPATRGRSSRARGCSISCQAMVGTPPVPVIFSRSISCSAQLRVPVAHHHELAAAGDRAGSARRSSRSRGRTAPTAGSSAAGRCGSGAGSGSPRRRKVARRRMRPAMMFEQACCAGCRARPWASRSCRRCRRSWRRPRDRARTSGSGRSGRCFQSLTSPITSSSFATFGCATSSPSRLTIDALQVGAVGQMFGQPLQPLAIDDRDLGAGIERGRIPAPARSTRRSAE